MAYALPVNLITVMSLNASSGKKTFPYWDCIKILVQLQSVGRKKCLEPN